MLPVIHTGRLTLRPWTRDDAAALQTIFDNEDVRRYLFDGAPVTMGQTESILEMHLSLQESRGIGYWAVLLQDAMIGFAGVSGDDEELELMYGLLPEYWGNGYATEASKAVLEHAKDAGYSNVVARSDPPNARSLRVMDRLGLQRRGVETGPQGQPLIVYATALG